MKALGQKCKLGILGIACVLSLLEGLLLRLSDTTSVLPLITWLYSLAYSGIPTCVSIHRLLDRVSYKRPSTINLRTTGMLSRLTAGLFSRMIAGSLYMEAHMI